MTALPADPAQPLPQIVKAARHAIEHQARDLLEAATGYAKDSQPGSPAVRERAALSKDGAVERTQSGFYVMALHQSRARLVAAYDHAISLARLLGGPGGISLFSHTCLSRSACEAAVRVNWILDARIDHEERILRGAVSLYNGLRDEMRTFSSLPATHVARAQGLPEQVQDRMDQFLVKAGAVGITALRHRGRITGFECGGVSVPVTFNVSDAMAKMLPQVPGWYALSSATAHGSAWMLLDSVQSPPNDAWLRMSPDGPGIGAAAQGVIASCALIIKVYAEYNGHNPEDRLRKSDSRHTILDRLMMEELETGT